MILQTLDGVSIKGINSVVPSNVIRTVDCKFFDLKEATAFIEATGIQCRRIIDASICASDLSEIAANRLIARVNWDKYQIKLLINISQSPDRDTPATAIMMQHRLGLSTDVLAFDINLGCSAYPYGVFVMNSLIASMPENSKGILTVGEIQSATCDPDDKSTSALFSDVGTATAFEKTSSVSPKFFNFYSDGSGADVITVLPAGPASRFPNASPYLQMDGPGVFSFVISKVPKMIKELLAHSLINAADLDYVVLHQANQLLNNRVIKKSRLETCQVLSSLSDYGNTSSASIPHTIASNVHHLDVDSRFLLAGFGVGLSCGSAIVNFSAGFTAELTSVNCMEVEGSYHRQN